MPKQLAVLVLLMVSFGTACNRQLTDADATDSFKKFLVSDLAESNARRGPEHASVGRPTLGADGKRYWSRCYIDRIKDYTVDVQKTNSVTTPYTATVSFTQGFYCGPERTSEAEASADTDFKPNLLSGLPFTLHYVYRDGKWQMAPKHGATLGDANGE